MADATANKAFADRLEAGYKAEIPKKERAGAEQVLGEDSLQFKLAPGGFRLLLEALDRGRPGGE